MRIILFNIDGSGSENIGCIDYLPQVGDFALFGGSYVEIIKRLFFSKYELWIDVKRHSNIINKFTFNDHLIEQQILSIWSTLRIHTNLEMSCKLSSPKKVTDAITGLTSTSSGSQNGVAISQEFLNPIYHCNVAKRYYA